MLRFECHACGKRISVPAEYGGKLVRCRNCGVTQTVPVSDKVNQEVHAKQEDDSDNSLLLAYLDEQHGKKKSTEAKQLRKARRVSKRHIGHASFKEICSALYDEFCESLRRWSEKKIEQIGMVIAGVIIVPSLFLLLFLSLRSRIWFWHGVELTVWHFLICIVIGVIFLFLKEKFE